MSTAARSPRYWLVAYLVIPHLLVSTAMVLFAAMAVRFWLERRLGIGHGVLLGTLWAGYQMTVCRLPAVVQLGFIGDAKRERTVPYAFFLALITLAAGFLASEVLYRSETPVLSVTAPEFPRPLGREHLRFTGAVPLAGETFTFEEWDSRWRRRRGTLDVLTVYVGAHMTAGTCLLSGARSELPRDAEPSQVSSSRAAMTRRAEGQLDSFEAAGGYVRLHEPKTKGRLPDVCQNFLAVTADPNEVGVEAFFVAFFTGFVALFPILALFQTPKAEVVASLSAEPSVLKRLFFTRPFWG